jgi:hypothetical protein
MAQLKAQPGWAGGPELVMLDDGIGRARYPAQHHHLDARTSQMRQLVGDGLAGGPAVHVEGMGQDQPALPGRNCHEVVSGKAKTAVTEP